MATNIDVLTRSHTVLKAKRRAKKAQIDSVVYDEQDRFEFLTGFQKRNIQKKETAKAKAKAREREERLQLRKEQRQALKVRAQENARQVESVFRQRDETADGESDDSDSAFETGSSTDRKGKGREVQEYEGEEQLATVTVIEDCDPDSFRHLPNPKVSALDGVGESKPPARVPIQAERPQHEKRSRREAKPTKKAYETKSARKVARLKQRSRKFEKAEVAGGKSRRKMRDRGKRGKKAKQ